MPIRAEAWFLYPGETSEVGRLATLRREEFDIPDLEADEVLAAPLYGGWEGNMGHALMRKPVDICRERGEPRVILGNSAVVRILEVGRDVTSVQPGQNALLAPGSEIDWSGFPLKIYGYDAPGTMGSLSTKMKGKGFNFVPLPEGTKHSLKRWGNFSIRYATAWTNWRLAYGMLRLLHDEAKLPAPNVWGWSGGTTFAELDLAHRRGCRVVMIGGSDKRLDVIKNAGFTPIDRRRFGSLDFDERRFATDLAFRRAYVAAEKAFLAEVERLTDGMMVQIFVDHIGTSVFRAVMKALGHGSVVCTAGWKEGMSISFLRAIECMGYHQHINTHATRASEMSEAVRYAEENDWLPPLEEPGFTFDEIPRLAEEYAAGSLGMFPWYSVNPP